ncbi:hypothetical protein V7S43_005103 [Phytophthora oleae]|uniref:Elicitin n=1 Tax=Phytophthora oleae TaxID=2107226 RepID=A0ABD3FS73_9STRA
MRSKEFLLIVCLLFIVREAVATTYKIDAYFSSSTCSGTPSIITAGESTACAAQCVVDPTKGVSKTLGSQKTICSTDYLTDIQGLFGSSKYIMMASFGDTNCTELDLVSAVLVSGSCQEASDDSGYVTASLNDDGSGTISMYKSQTCAASDLDGSIAITAADLKSHSCDSDGRRWYSSNDVTTTSTKSASPGLSMGAIVGVIGAGVVSILVV